MDRKRKLTLGAATLAVALGAGHLVQSGISQAKTEQRSVSADQMSTSPTGITQLAASVKPTAAAHGARPASRLAEAAALAAETAIPASFVPEPPLAATAVDAEVSATCRATLDIIPAANAVLDLVLLAPCHPDTRVVLRHGGLAITGQTSAGGALFVSIPAIESSGEVSARFPDGSLARAARAVDLSQYRRFAVQWVADDRFALNAYEHGAIFGGPGHVDAKAAGSPAADRSHGWMTVLGDASVDLPMQAEVYTFPAKVTDVSVTLEAEVTDATCARELLAETLDSQSGVVVATDVTLAMPDCTAVGDFLVLNNLQTGMTTAAAE